MACRMPPCSRAGSYHWLESLKRVWRRRTPRFFFALLGSAGAILACWPALGLRTVRVLTAENARLLAVNTISAEQNRAPYGFSDEVNRLLREENARPNEAVKRSTLSMSSHYRELRETRAKRDAALAIRPVKTENPQPKHAPHPMSAADKIRQNAVDQRSGLRSSIR